MKKMIIIIFAICFFPTIVNAATDKNWNDGNTINNLETISLTKVKSFTKGSEVDDVVAQGFTITDKHYIVSQVVNDNDYTKVLFINRDTLTIDKIISDQKLGHSNDFAYNNKTKQIVGGYRLSNNSSGYDNFVAYFNSDSLSYIRSSSSNVYASGIAFDSVKNKYYSFRSKKTFELSSDLNNETELFTASDYAMKYLVPQGMGYYDGYFYYPMYEYGMSSSREYYNSLEKGSNVIVIYDINGNYIKTLYIPNTTVTGELENVEFDEYGQMYLLYNEHTSPGAISIYKMNYSNNQSQNDNNSDVINNPDTSVNSYNSDSISVPNTLLNNKKVYIIIGFILIISGSIVFHSTIKKR